MLSASEAAALGHPEAHDTAAWQSGECVYCAGRGKAGRTALFEMFPVGEEMAQLISGGADEVLLHELARKDGCRALPEDALRKVAQGIVTAPDAQGAVAVW